jgi:hypothetical protein
MFDEYTKNAKQILIERISKNLLLKCTKRCTNENKKTLDYLNFERKRIFKSSRLLTWKTFGGDFDETTYLVFSIYPLYWERKRNYAYLRDNVLNINHFCDYNQDIQKIILKYLSDNWKKQNILFQVILTIKESTCSGCADWRDPKMMEFLCLRAEIFKGEYFKSKTEAKTFLEHFEKREHQ